MWELSSSYVYVYVETLPAAAAASDGAVLTSLPPLPHPAHLLPSYYSDEYDEEGNHISCYDDYY
jgi:hypothetical protein